MRQSLISVTFLSSLFFLSDCASGAKVVAYDIARALPEAGQTATSSRSRRATISEVLSNNLTLGAYYVSVQIGTPAQKLNLSLGTGSSDIWVADSLAPICSTSTCLTPFNPNSSSTISTIDAGGFDITYDDGEYAKGDYIKDVFAFDSGGAIALLQMGLAANMTAFTASLGGVMGIGYNDDEATSVQYPGFIDQLVSSGIINTKIYSIWLNDLYSSTGSVLFGGIDTDKYYGTLSSMDVIKDNDGNYTSLQVGLTSISITPQTGQSSIQITNVTFSTPVVLESSTTVIYLPTDTVNDIYNLFDVTLVGGTAFIDCKYSNSSYMSFGFESGTIINVMYSEFINKNPIFDTPPNNLSYSDICGMAILDAGSDSSLLGDYFLRSVYAVYDLTNNRIAIAQSNLNSTTSHVIEIPVSAASIPQVTGVALPNPSTSSTTSSTSSSSTSTKSPTISPTNTPKPKSNHDVAIGVGVAVPVVVIFAAIVGILLYLRRRRRSQAPTNSSNLPEMYNEPQATGAAGSDVKHNYTTGHENNYPPSPSSPVPAYVSGSEHYYSGQAAPHSPFTPSSPTDTNPGFEGMPITQGPSELYGSHDSELRSPNMSPPVSPNPNDHQGEHRPL